LINLSNTNDAESSQDRKNTVIQDTYKIKELDIEKLYNIFYRWFQDKINTEFVKTVKPTYLKVFRKEDHLRQSLNPIRQRRRIRPRHIPSIFVINLKEVDDSVSIEIKINLTDDYEKLQYSQFKHLQLEDIKKNWNNHAVELRTLLNEHLDEKLDLTFSYFKKSPVNQ